MSDFTMSRAGKVEARSWRNEYRVGYVLPCKKGLLVEHRSVAYVRSVDALAWGAAVLSDRHLPWLECRPVAQWGTA